jgi:hypothetical protein
LREKAEIEAEANHEKQGDECVGGFGEDVGSTAAENIFGGTAAEGAAHASVGAWALHENDEHGKNADDCEDECKEVVEIQHVHSGRHLGGKSASIFFEKKAGEDGKKGRGGSQRGRTR